MAIVDGLIRDSSLTLRGLHSPCGARRLCVLLGATLVAGACADPTAGHYTISDVRHALGTTASITVVTRDVAAVMEGPSAKIVGDGVAHALEQTLGRTDAVRLAQSSAFVLDPDMAPISGTQNDSHHPLEIDRRLVAA